MKQALIAVLASAALLAGFACQQKQHPPAASLNESMALAVQQGKPLLIDFYAEWCGPCQKFTKASHEDPDVMKALEQVVLCKVDCEKGEGIELAKTYTVRGYPTFVLADDKAVTIARWAGYSKDYFLKNLDKSLADLTTIDEKLARFDKNPKVTDALALAQYNSSIDNYKKAVEYYAKAEQIGKDQHYSFDIFQNTVSGAASGEFTFDDAAKAAQQVFSSDTTENKVYTAYKMSNLAREDGKTEEMSKYLQMGIDAAKGSDNPDVREINDYLQIDYSLYVVKDTAKAIEFKKATLGENWTDDPQQLNSFAWWCYENDCNLEEAEALAKKAVDLSDPGSSKAMILDTVAHIVRARGNNAEAIKYMEMAVKEDPGNSQYQETLDKFKQEL